MYILQDMFVIGLGSLGDSCVSGSKMEGWDKNLCWDSCDLEMWTPNPVQNGVECCAQPWAGSSSSFPRGWLFTVIQCVCERSLLHVLLLCIDVPPAWPQNILLESELLFPSLDVKSI